jgi:hypothetical protein|tara:strand:+ start:344 stop:511 length:168 start_codon:yes stop_codon:yes gene_type:complete
MGSTKEDTLLETPAFFSTQRMVTGRVALEELVENAVAKAEAIAEKCLRGFMPVKI